MPTDGGGVFVIKFRPLPRVSDPIKALRAVLKFALRRCGLKCISAEQVYDAEDDFGKSIELAYETIRERKAAGGKGWEPKP